MTSVPAGSPFAYKLVVVARKDLKLSAGKLAAQVAHAAVDCALKALRNDERTFQAWHREGQKKVVVRAETLDELHVLKEEAEAKRLSTALISDAGLTEIPAGTVTVLGIGPGPNEVLDRITGHLSLV